jgi:hypothetical protein
MTAASDWLDQARRLLDAVVQGQAAPAAAGEARHRADCAWCPLCQAAAVVRGERPEVTAALADVLTATATALRAFAAEGTPASSTAGEPDRAEPADGDPPPTVQRIEIA